MINVGLIGYGKWGKIIHTKLKKFTNVKFICRRGDDFRSLLDEVEWIVIATPNETHYKIVRSCIEAGKNVFCEKPLTESYKDSDKLFRLAHEKGVLLYVDDIQNYRNSNFNFTRNNFIERRKKSEGQFKDIIYRLLYHDIYVLYDYIKDSDISNIENISKDGIFNFSVEFGDSKVEFLYDLNFNGNVHKINGIDQSGQDDILFEMLHSVINCKVDFILNKKVTLFTIRTVNQLRKNLIKSVAVIGGGIFGCTSAWYLSKNGFDVDLFEKNKDILRQASGINQYRLHSGYHYPRSKSTASSSLSAHNSFMKEYGDSVILGTENYYSISKNDSLVNGREYVRFLEDLSLSYETVENLEILKNDSIELTIKAQESLFSSDFLRNLVWKKLKKHKVNIFLESEASISISDKYDYIVIATYSNINEILANNSVEKQIEYQFELCEKPVFRLPLAFQNKSVVIMDGPFMCIDPMSDSGNHVAGNVVHAIHSTNIGKLPEIPLSFKKLMNKGIIKKPGLSKKELFLGAMKKFFNNVDDFRYIGSMFTIRTVLPGREDDDARPTIVEKFEKNTFVVFSGKIGTCVDAASELLSQIQES